MRSAGPTIRAGVIAAKVSWKAMNTYSGMYTPLLKVAASEPGVTPARNSRSKLPKNCVLPWVNASE
jgi:hypothetical protein